MIFNFRKKIRLQEILVFLNNQIEVLSCKKEFFYFIKDSKIFKYQTIFIKKKFT